ncbi:uncharacterized protein LOC144342151 [Saccoglossus kowalevskii]
METGVHAHPEASVIAHVVKQQSKSEVEHVTIHLLPMPEIDRKYCSVRMCRCRPPKKQKSGENCSGLPQNSGRFNIESCEEECTDGKEYTNCEDVVFPATCDDVSKKTNCAECVPGCQCTKGGPGGPNSPGRPGGPTISPDEKEDVPQPGELLGPGGPGNPLRLGGPGGPGRPGRPGSFGGTDLLVNQVAPEDLHYLLKRKKI